MPKARRKKTATKRSSKGWPFKRGRGVAAAEVELPVELNGARTVEPPPPEKLTFVGRLLANEGEGLFLLTSIAPLPIGAWVAGGLMLQNPGTFGLLIGLVAVTRWIKLVRARRDSIVGANEIILVMYAGIIALSLFFYSATDSGPVSLLVALTGFLGVAFDRLEFESVFSLFLGAATLIVRMATLAMLGVFCQFPELVPSTAVLGFVPGAVLAAALFARHADVMERHGWLRSFPHTDKKGITSTRPGGVSRAYSLMLLVGLAFPVALAPFYIFPKSFVLVAILLYFVPGLCSAFIERSRSDAETALRTLTLGAAASFTVLFLGVLAPYL